MIGKLNTEGEYFAQPNCMQTFEGEDGKPF